MIEQYYALDELQKKYFHALQIRTYFRPSGCVFQQNSNTNNLICIFINM